MPAAASIPSRAALDQARRRHLLTVALPGRDGGATRCRGPAEHPIVGPSDPIAGIAEVQASIDDIIREPVECPDA